MTAQAYELLRWQGYGRMMGRSAHPTGVKLYERLGGRGSGEVTFEWKGKQHQLYLITLDAYSREVNKVFQMARSLQLSSDTTLDQ